MTMGPSTARDTILTRLRSAATDHKSLFRSHGVVAEQDTAPSAVTNATGGAVELARTFGENLRVVLGTYEIVDSADVPQQIAARIEQWKNQREEPCSGELLSWAPGELGIDGLAEQLTDIGFSLSVPDDLSDGEQRTHAATFSVGLTGVDAAFAGTGSMVFIPGVGKSRSASLLPLHHVTLVPTSKIFPNLESWIAALRNDGELESVFREHSQLVFITGPSKSADIELNLTLGVHGPRDVHAIIFDDRR